MSLALDTNVLVRLLTRDDENQFADALKLISAAAEIGEPAMLYLAVLLETEWVLRSRYKLTRAEIHKAFVAIMETQELAVQQPAVLEEALMLWHEWPGSDFADCLHVAASTQDDRVLATFDQAAARLPGAVLVSKTTT